MEEIRSKRKKDNQSIQLKKKTFKEPEVKVYRKLEDITLFTSTQNVSGGVFF